MYAKYNASEAALTRQNIELKKACDEAVVAAREREKERCDGIVKELRQQVVDYEATKKELENRAEGYLNELRDARIDHDTRNKSTRVQIEKLQEELDRLVTQNSTLKESLANEEKSNRLLELDLSEAKTRLSEVTDKSKKWYAELVQTTEEKNRLAQLSAKLQAEVNHLQACRQSDFNSVAGSVLKVMGRELDSLRINMGIPVNENDQ